MTRLTAKHRIFAMSCFAECAQRLEYSHSILRLFGASFVLLFKEKEQ
jgi:hypothetical protein